MKDKIIRLALEFCFFCAIIVPLSLVEHYLGTERLIIVASSLILFKLYGLKDELYDKS